MHDPFIALRAHVDALPTAERDALRAQPIDVDDLHGLQAILDDTSTRLEEVKARAALVRTVGDLMDLHAFMDAVTMVSK